jgi:hypothetical protein
LKETELSSLAKYVLYFRVLPSLLTSLLSNPFHLFILSSILPTFLPPSPSDKIVSLHYHYAYLNTTSLIHGEEEVQFHAFFIMAPNRSAVCPNCFTPHIVLLVHSEEDDGRDAELVWIHAKEKSL